MNSTRCCYKNVIEINMNLRYIKQIIELEEDPEQWQLKGYSACVKICLNSTVMVTMYFTNYNCNSGGTLFSSVRQVSRCSTKAKMKDACLYQLQFLSAISLTGLCFRYQLNKAMPPGPIWYAILRSRKFHSLLMTLSLL